MMVTNCRDCKYLFSDFDEEWRWVRVCQNPKSHQYGEISGTFPNHCHAFVEKYPCSHPS
jgi:hypothetical protein